MNLWPPKAVEALAVTTERLRTVGVVKLLEEHTAATWKSNVDRYEPTEFGDTPRTLAVTASENLRVLVERECTGEGSPWQQRGVHAVTEDNSLVIRRDGVQLRIKKAPKSTVREPDWAAFDWSADSGCRQEAAARNTALYLPPVTANGQDVISDWVMPHGDATLLRDVMVVWSGEIETGLTAGWLGFPALGPSPWLAVEQLWWHDIAPAGRRVPITDPQTPGGPTFLQRQQPEPRIVLKPRREQGTS